MSDILGVHARPNPVTDVAEFYDTATKRTVLPLSILGQTPASPVPVLLVPFTATLAQINAGYTFIPADANRNIFPIRFRFTVTGNFATLTDIRLSDTNGTPVDIVTLVQANATNGNVVTDAGGTGITIGAGFGATLTAGKGVQIRQTGSAGTGGTSVSGFFEFILQ